jgi:hypothetical protein
MPRKASLRRGRSALRQAGDISVAFGASDIVDEYLMCLLSVKIESGPPDVLIAS